MCICVEVCIDVRVSACACMRAYEHQTYIRQTWTAVV